MNEIKSDMTAAELTAAINENTQDLMEKWGCKHHYSFREVTTDNTTEEFIELMNANLRTDKFYVGMSGMEFAEAANKIYHSLDTRRFQDHLIKDIAFSGSGEPSSIVSEDGNRLDVFGTFFYTYTIDGVNFADPCRITFDDATYGNDHYCTNIFRHDGKYYCTTAESGNTLVVLWEEAENTVWGDTTNDKIFTNPKVILEPVTGLAWYGNAFTFKNDDEWYMIIEARGDKTNGWWKLFMTSSETLDGEYTYITDNPIVGRGISAHNGNPDLITYQGIPYKADGKYFMMYHYHKVDSEKSMTYIYRAYSYDLTNWTDEGPILDGREAPEKPLWTNGDQSVCEFKGHSYLFYTENANQYLDPMPGYPPRVDVCMDMRPFSELLRLKP